MRQAIASDPTFRQREFTADMLNKPAEINSFLNAIREAFKRKGSDEDFEKRYKHLEALYEAEIEGKADEKREVLLETVALYQFRIHHDISKSDNLNEWQWEVFYDAYSLAKLAALVNDEQDTAYALVALADKMVMHLSYPENFRPTDTDITSPVLKALNVYRDNFSPNPRIMKCIAELQLIEAKIDASLDVLDAEQDTIDEQEIADSREEIKARFNAVISLSSEAIREAKGDTDCEEAIYNTWERAMLTLARFHLDGNEEQEFVNTVNTVTSQNPSCVEANLLMVRYKLEKEPENAEMIEASTHLLMDLLTQSPKNPELIYLIGRLSMAKGEVASARYYLGMLDPESVFHGQLIELIRASSH